MATTADLTTLDALAKDVYPFGSKYWDQFNEGTPTLDLIDSGGQVPFLAKHEGRRILVPLRTAGNPNAASPVAVAAGFPVPGVQTWNKAIYNIATLVSSFRIEGIVFDTMTGGDQSVTDGFAAEMDSQAMNANRRVNNAMHQDGSGIIGVLAGTSGTGASRTYTLASMSNMAMAEIGTEIEILDLNSGAVATGLTGPGATDPFIITGVSNSTPTAPTITFATTAGNAITGDATTPADNGAYRLGAQGNDIAGFGIMVSTTDPANWGSTSSTYGGISRGANEFWRGHQLNATTTATTTFSIEDHINPLVDKIDERAGPTLQGDLLGFVRYDNWRALGTQLSRGIRVSVAPGQLTRKLAGGYDALQVQNVNFVLDRDAPAKKVRIISPKSMYRYIMRPWFWDDRTGSIWSRETHGTATQRPMDRFRANFLSRQQLLTVQNTTAAEVYNLAATN